MLGRFGQNGGVNESTLKRMQLGGLWMANKPSFWSTFSDRWERCLLENKTCNTSNAMKVVLSATNLDIADVHSIFQRSDGKKQ